MAKKEVKKEKAAKISDELKKLRAAAEDINSVYEIEGFTPAELNEAELKDAFKELETQIPADDDQLEESTWEVLKGLDLECARQRFNDKDDAPKAKKEEDEGSEDSDVDDGDSDDIDEGDKEEEAQKKPAKKNKKASKDEDEEEEDDKEEEAPKKPAKKASKDEDAEEKPAKKKGPQKAGGLGVIGSIPEILKSAPKTGISFEDIAKELHSRFPDRKVSSLLGTVKVQVSSRLKKEKGLNIICVSKGMYKL